jgi:hypothetical protein
MKILQYKHKHVFYQHDKNLWKKVHIVVSAEKINLSIVNNKSICSKLHQILLFLHISLNMLFLTKFFLVVTTHSHVHCQNISDFFFDFAYYFLQKIIGTGAYEPRFKCAFSICNTCYYSKNSTQMSRLRKFWTQYCLILVFTRVVE